ncbi:MAG TPA: phosphatase PAP2 family protein [Vineibacter sp.]|nr:phosphatase PAP2 family protein [Vineibacter sp.]
MARWHVRPTRLDRDVAATMSRYATPALERPAKTVTGAADDHILLTGAVALWLASRGAPARRRHQADYLMANLLVAVTVPRLLKGILSQERPDRTMVRGRRHGIPRSGDPDDAFPSGHAIHIGALCAAAGRLWPQARPVAWTIGGILATTRVVLLAHWVSDVAAGLVIGLGIERLLSACVHRGDAARSHDRPRRHIP